MGNPITNRADGSFENESVSISAYIALDGAANVIGFMPTATPPTAVGPYSRLKGAQNALGPAGAIKTQPHLSAGVYSFTLDEPWFAGTEAWVQLVDQGAVAGLSWYIDANVGPNTLGGAWPGNNPALTPQTVRIRFRSAAAGTLTDPVVSTAFYWGIKLKRTGV
jgi:hypothetical protein